MQIFNKMVINDKIYCYREINENALNKAFDSIRTTMGNMFSNGRTVRLFIDRLKYQAMSDVESNQERVFITLDHAKCVVENWR